MRVSNQLILISSACLFLSACSSLPKQTVQDGPPQQHVDAHSVPNAVPKHLPRSRYGNPVSYEVFGKRYHVLPTAKGYTAKGYASWYGTKFHGRRTSSGEPYNMYAMTAASRVLPLPTYARVTNLENGKSIIVKVNDRGPFHSKRIIDLSYVAAKKLDMVKDGTAYVQVTAITPGQPLPPTPQTIPVAPGKSLPDSNHPDALFIQVGAFSQENNAEDLANRIKAITQYGVYIKKTGQGERVLYRVQVGPFKNIQTIEKARENLRNDGFDHIVTVSA